MILEYRAFSLPVIHKLCEDSVGMSKIKIFLSDSLHPHLNLATEEWIFNNLDPAFQILFLWRNEETVVIGRNQNPWAECNLAKMKADRVHLARRTTGGGAVFHDLGNTNFTFLSPRQGYKRENNIAVILNGLRKLGIEGEASGRNDLFVSSSEGPKKFSGSAYREKVDRAFHHGTLLLHADLTRLGNYLTPNPKKLKAKGKESVRAQVTNLSEIVPEVSHPAVVRALVESFEEFYGAKAEVENLSLESLGKIPELKNQFDRLSSFDWLYGRTLEFTQQMDDYLSLGFFDFHFLVEEAVVKQVQIFTDCLFPDLIDRLQAGFTKKIYGEQTVRSLFADLRFEFPEIQAGLAELEAWLIARIEA